MKKKQKQPPMLVTIPDGMGGSMTFDDGPNPILRAYLKKAAPPAKAQSGTMPKNVPGATKTAYPKTGTRRRRKTFADGSHVIVSSSGYEIFEGIPKSKKSKVKPTAKRKSPPSSQSNSPGAES